MDELVQLHHEYLRRLSVGAVGAWLRLDLTLPQLRLLYLVVREGGTPAGVLARRLRLAPSTVSELADRLAHRGLVRRADDPRDRRCVEVSATEAGVALVDDLLASRREQLVELFGRLDPADRERVAGALRILIRATPP